MAKPSIFSKNYERRMKKRKRLITLAVVLVLIGLVVIVFNSKIKNLDFTNVRANIQAWVDSGRPEEEQTISEPSVEESDENLENTEEETQEPQETYMEITVAEGVSAQVQYIEEDGVKKFVQVTPIDGYEFNISPSRTELVFSDPSQNIKIANTEGIVTDITKTSYTSTSGTVFEKDTILAATPTYTWQSQPRFIDDNTIAYVSELPYFGNSGSEKYVWIYNMATGTDSTVWAFKSSNIILGDTVANYGLLVTVDGVEYYLTADGNATQKVEEAAVETPAETTTEGVVTDGDNTTEVTTTEN